MRLAFKITLFFLGSICLVMAWYGWERIERETELFQNQMRRDHYAIAQPLAVIIARAWEEFGEEFATNLVQTSNDADERVRIRWVWVNRGGVERIRPEAPDDAGARLAEGMAVSWIDRDQIRAGRLYTYVPVVAEGERIGALELSESFEEERQYIQDSQRRILQTTGLILFIAAVISLFTGVLFIGRPVEALVQKARAVGRGDFRTPASLRGKNELSYLAREMNLMGERLANTQGQLQEETDARIRALEQLRHADRLKTVGTLSAGIAHELGTPLNVISMRAEMLARGEVDEDDVSRNAKIIGEQAARITSIIRQLMDFARTRPLQTEVIPVTDLAARAMELIQPIAEKKQVCMELLKPQGAHVAEVDPDQLLQVLTNLLVNAAHACIDAGGGEVTVQIRDGEEENTVAIDVIDTGTGIPEEHLSSVFEPFFTTKPIGEGTGLGLSVSYGIIAEHGGTLSVKSTPGEGATFTVVLPTKESR